MNPWLERLEAFMKAMSSGATLKVTRDSWIRPAEAALVEAEAESEVYEPDAWVDYDHKPRPREYVKCPKCNGDMVLKHHCEQRLMTWPGWAVPAILEVLANHKPDGDIHRPGFYCTEFDGSAHGIYRDLGDWQAHVAPLIADRIACDPQRAIEALSRKVIS